MSDMTFEEYIKSIGATKKPMLMDIDGGASFAGFFAFSIREDQPFTKQFLDATGLKLPVPRQTMIEKIIDDACGRKIEDEYREVLGKYVDWLIVNHWGEEGSDISESAEAQTKPEDKK